MKIFDTVEYEASKLHLLNACQSLTCRCTTESSIAKLLVMPDWLQTLYSMNSCYSTQSSNFYCRSWCNQSLRSDLWQHITFHRSALSKARCLLLVSLQFVTPLYVSNQTVSIVYIKVTIIV